MCNDCHRTEAKDYWRALVRFYIKFLYNNDLE